MPKVNFYLLKQSTVQARQLLACKLAEQLSRQGQRVYMLLRSADELAELDQLLWSFSAESFVPHATATDAAATHVGVLLGTVPQAPAGFACLLNLTGELVARHASVATIAEFVLNDSDSKARGRALWNAYKELGCELQHHQL